MPMITGANLHYPSILSLPSWKARTPISSLIRKFCGHVLPRHEGDPSSSSNVTIVYEKGGKLYRVRAKGAVLAIGSWIAKRIATDIPADYQEALTNILHGPTRETESTLSPNH